MKPLTERLRLLGKTLEADSYGSEHFDDLQLAATLLETHMPRPNDPSKNVPTVAEERLAWDCYASASLTSHLRNPPEDTTIGRFCVWAAGDADELLEERRKRFGA